MQDQLWGTSSNRRQLMALGIFQSEPEMALSLASVVALLLLVVLIDSASTAGTLRLPIKRHVPTYEGSTNSVKRSAVWSPDLPDLVGSVDHSIPLFNRQDSMYIVEISVGTPPQGFNMLFDARQSAPWVPSLHLAKHHAYDHNKSSTYEADGTPFDWSGVSGELSRDIVRVGGLEIRSQLIGEADDMSGIGGYDKLSFDGMIGFGFDPINHMPKDSLLYRLVHDKLIDNAMFGVFLGSNGSDGEITLGGVNERHYTGDFKYVGLVNQDQCDMCIELRAWKVGDTIIKVQDTILVDTSMDLFYGPQDAIAKIANALGATKEPWIDVFDVYWVYCDAKLPDFELHLGEHSFKLSPNEYVRIPIGQNKCELAFVGVPDENMFWIMGAAFLRGYYAVFDNTASTPRIGFAPVAPASD